LLLMLENIAIKKDILQDEKYLNLFTVEEVNKLVFAGIPFRDAYLEISKRVKNNTFETNVLEVNHTHEGSLGNLCNDKIAELFKAKLKRFK
jgi:argininosuccinate lyase